MVTLGTGLQERACQRGVTCVMLLIRALVRCLCSSDHFKGEGKEGGSAEVFSTVKKSIRKYQFIQE